MTRSREEVEELRSALAHELKTPLAVISGYVELLRIREDPRSREEAMDRIAEATQQLADAVNRAVDMLVPPVDE